MLSTGKSDPRGRTLLREDLRSVWYAYAPLMRSEPYMIVSGAKYRKDGVQCNVRGASLHTTYRSFLVAVSLEVRGNVKG